MQTKNKSVKKHCYVMTVEKEQKLKDQDYLFVQTSVSLELKFRQNAEN